MKNYNRLFAFGCSFTKWPYPTWADIISWELNIPYQNWGIYGLGNTGIFHRMVESDILNTFTENDLILVMWSSWTREDRYINGKWEAHGSVLNNVFYDENFIKKYWSLENDIIKNATAIIVANKIFNINYNASIMPLDALIESDGSKKTLLMPREKEIYDFYRPHTVNMDTCEFHGTNSPGFKRSGHPTILDHLSYAGKAAKHVGITLSDNIINICHILNQRIIDTNDDQVITTEMLKDEFNLHWNKFSYFGL